mgnify:CR=1 FL=1
MPDISAAIRAAEAIAAAIDTEGTSIPPCVVSLAPRVLEADGELAASLYAVPMSVTNTREARRLVLREAAVALVLLAPVDDEAAAASALAEFQALADSLLSSGSSPEGSVKFVNWNCDELFDQELLADQQILRSQIDVSCTILDTLQ